jgi:MoxR-like ATPase
MINKITLLKNEIQNHILGQSGLVDALLIGLLTEGHILLEGLPGLAKTTLANTLAQTLALGFKRVQFTPDLLPADIIGAEIYDMQVSQFKIKHGPIFTNILLADEINRAPAKVQSALLEAMQEKQVTIGEKSFPIEEPFFVLATQNPIEQNGTYPLPEAQLDRFMFKLIVSYNTQEEEFEIAKKVAFKTFSKVQTIFDAQDLAQIKKEILEIHIDDELIRYIVSLVSASRKHRHLKYGASPRASIDMLKAVKARAYLRGHDYVSPIDIVLTIKDVLRHRIVLNYDALYQGLSADAIIQDILESVVTP